MSLAALIPRHLVRESLAKFLLIGELPHVQALDTHAKAAFEDAGTWWESASAALPNFKLSRDLLHATQRGEFMAVFKTFLLAAVADNVEVPVRSMDEARKLSKLLVNAKKAMDAHRARGGSLAGVVIGRLAFDQKTIGEALEEMPSHEHGAGDTELCLGTTVALRGQPTRKESAHLRLHFAWQGGGLLVSARDDGTPSHDIEMPQDFYSVYQNLLGEPSPGRRPLTLDVMSLCPALTLNHRGVAVPMNAAWQAAASGIFALTKGKAAAIEALAQGVLCVLCVRDGMPEHTTYLAKTLHLDTPQR